MMKRLLMISLLAAACLAILGTNPALARSADLPEGDREFSDKFLSLLDEGRLADTYALVGPALDVTEHEFARVTSERESMDANVAGGFFLSYFHAF